MRTLLASVTLALLAGCARAAVQTPDDTEYHRVGALEISATVERDDFWDVFGAIDLMNTGRDTVRLEYEGYCGVAILMYQGKRTVPRWDSTEWWTRRQGECPNGLMNLDIPPETLARIVAPAVDAQGILGDSLPAGSYAAAMRIRLLEPRDTTLLLSAGRIELDRPDSGRPNLAVTGRR